MLSTLRFALLYAIKLFAMTFYRFHETWIGSKAESSDWDNIKVAVLLNHTTLIEPIFVGVLPNRFLWRIASQGLFPVADITMNRPIVGKLIRALAPDVVSLTRKRDNSWDYFLGRIRGDGLLLFLPEGRMKRPSGLDKYGQPMTVKGGIVDALTIAGSGQMLVAYSGGLHHVLAPGERRLRLNQDISIKFELIDIASYLQSFRDADGIDAKALRSDLEHRRDLNC